MSSLAKQRIKDDYIDRYTRDHAVLLVCTT